MIAISADHEFIVSAPMVWRRARAALTISVSRAGALLQAFL